MKEKLIQAKKNHVNVRKLATSVSQQVNMELTRGQRELLQKDIDSLNKKIAFVKNEKNNIISSGREVSLEILKQENVLNAKLQNKIRQLSVPKKLTPSVSSNSGSKK